MFHLLTLVRVLGVRQVLKLARAKRFAGSTLIRGFFTTPIIVTLLNTGFFDEIVRKDQINLDAFALQHGLDKAILQSLGDYLYAMKVLDKRGDDYVLDSRGRLIVEVLPGSFYSAGAYADIFYNMESLLRREKRYGVDVNRNTALAARGSGDAGKLFVFPLVADLIQRRGFTHVLDLGCGDAAFLIDLCKDNPRLHGYGLDLSTEAIAEGNRNVEQANLQDRIQLFAEDMFNIRALTGQLEGVEVATSFFVMHELLSSGAGRVMEFLQAFAEACPRAHLVVCESIRHTPEQLRERPGPLMEFQLVHDLSGQRPVSRQEWRSIFEEAGFHSIEEEYFEFARLAIYVVH